MGLLNSIARSTTRLRIQRLLPQERPRIKPDCVQDTKSLTRARTFVNKITAYSLYRVVSKHTGRKDATVAPPAFFGIGRSVPIRSMGGRSQANDQMRVINTNIECRSTQPPCLIYSGATLSCPGDRLEFRLRTPSSNSLRVSVLSSSQDGSSQL